MPSVVLRDAVADQPSASLPALAPASQRNDPYVPPSAAALAPGGPRPSRVTTCTTPAIASEPYSTLPGPRTISIRSTLSVVRLAKLYAPPGWFTGTPSTSTFT